MSYIYAYENKWSQHLDCVVFLVVEKDFFENKLKGRKSICEILPYFNDSEEGEELNQKITDAGLFEQMESTVISDKPKEETEEILVKCGINYSQELQDLVDNLTDTVG